MHAAMRVMHGSSAPMSPVAGYTAWYDASQITGVADGATLATWPDQGPHGQNLSVASGSTGPTFYKTTSANLINGLPAVWFPGGNATVMQAFGSTYNDTPRPFTWFAVAKDAAPASTAIRHIMVPAGGYVEPWTASGQYNVWGGTATLTGGTADTTPHVFCWEFTATTNVKMYVDGTVILNGAAGSAGIPPSNAFGVGGEPTPTGGTNGLCWNGAICEVLAYPSDLSSSDIASNSSYLKHKWGTP